MTLFSKILFKSPKAGKTVFVSRNSYNALCKRYRRNNIKTLFGYKIKTKI